MRGALLLFGAAALAGCASSGSRADGGVRLADVAAVRATIDAAKGKPLVLNHWASW